MSLRFPELLMAAVLLTGLAGCSGDGTGTTAAGGGGQGGSSSGGEGGGVTTGGGGAATGGGGAGGGGTGGGDPLGVALDPSFGADGVALLNSGANEDEITASLYQPDGKLILVGTTWPNEEGQAFAMRTNADGTLDVSYGEGGKRLVPLHAGTDAYAAARLEDGRLVMVGQARSGDTGHALVVRLTEGGDLDTTFGDGGHVILETGPDYRADARSVLALPGGQLIVGLVDVDGYPRLVKVNEDGSVDTSFGSAGLASFPPQVIGDVNAIAGLSDGSLVALASGAFGAENYLSHFSADGVLDTGFGGMFSDGYVESLYDWFYMATDASDRIVVAGRELRRFLADGTEDPSFPGAFQSDEILDLKVAPDGSMWFVRDTLIGFDEVVRRSADGQDDPSFGVAGTAEPPLDTIRRIAVDPSGGVTAVGTAFTAANDISVARLAGDGSVDASFGTMGKATLNSNAMSDRLRGAALGPDGSIFVRGEGRIVWKLTPDGVLDPSFSEDGTVSKFGQTGPFETAFAVTPAGEVLVPSGNWIQRFLPDGSLDTGFGDGGTVTVVTGANVVPMITGTALDDSGRMIVAGFSGAYDNLLVARLLPDGTLDPDFQGGDFQTIPGPGFATSVVVAGDGRIVVASFAAGGSGAVVRLLPDGELDPTFGDGGVVLLAPLDVRAPTQVLIAADGHLLVAGSNDDCSADDVCATETVVVRLAPNGQPDATFGDGGSFRHAASALKSTLYEPVEGRRRRIGLAFDPSGGLLVGTGERTGAREHMTLLRLFANGTLDLGFGEKGVFHVEGEGNWHARDLRVLPDGELLVLGEVFSQTGGRDIGVLRFTLSAP